MSKTIKELNKLDVEKLQAELLAARKELSDNKFKLGCNELTDVSLLEKGKRNIARILTVIKEKGSES